ncbi:MULTISPECIES: SDR family NAD(P)-dependent oxidoreductase [unclassified Shinella]|jgi:NAD(P)-dependent dehydrogenase (short-subunit alcohol dehydrogenase family)|uniref:SDR family NAD(P)-dependent oxidoreductase n=1 Tax=unclassified Shinella TaxID=2643062 RepID=UPI0003C56BC0|nr:MULTISPECIES: glucose 1-dehydrogenase [unclassified Shinella]MCA0340834.1 glucose 1-dehydrogenase [Pseudomonadota bacterium]EYR82528.1 dehydrogenase [Shinella sp. DD12]KNY14492.1 2-deoxy-D-gluconate 3-dehydrogenase [Shinella sp. SUS2]KOC74145.1 2-deoxy-D-gluconate 3-dehydrogenase [Shinella sp. GWS1]MCO5149168.1 glucose 1-dehydrogenase [Shinella sp.]
MNRPIFDLSSRRALVTGASRGIGQAIAVALAEAGADVAVTARALEGLAETRALVEKAGRRCVALVQDVRDVEASAAVTAVAADALGGLDILINNAGFENVRPSFDVDEALWESILSTNLKGAFFCAQAAGRIMARSGGGAIVNLCSLTSYVGIPTAVPYGASKSGLLGVTRALATEWAPHNIRVNAIAPGYFRTAMTEAFYENEEWQTRMLDKIPQRRFGGEGDIGGVAVFLCSDAAAYVTGHCIPVDGGYLASI